MIQNNFCEKHVKDGLSSRFFEKKRRKKLLLLWARGAETSTAQFSKVFLLLFVHKK
jgi:hypothetical protein